MLFYGIGFYSLCTLIPFVGYPNFNACTCSGAYANTHHDFSGYFSCFGTKEFTKPIKQLFEQSHRYTPFSLLALTEIKLVAGVCHERIEIAIPWNGN